jgi:hypothetical protein
VFSVPNLIGAIIISIKLELKIRCGEVQNIYIKILGMPIPQNLAFPRAHKALCRDKVARQCQTTQK